MNFKKTTEYSLRILSHLAQQENKIFTVDEISENIEIPYRYLRKLMTSLSKSELIESMQGSNGGYRIKKELDQIMLIDIIRIIEPEILNFQCFFGLHQCALDDKCVMHDKWAEINMQVKKILEETSLQDLKKNGKEISFINNYSLKN